MWTAMSESHSNSPFFLVPRNFFCSHFSFGHCFLLCSSVICGFLRACPTDTRFPGPLCLLKFSMFYRGSPFSVRFLSSIQLGHLVVGQVALRR